MKNGLILAAIILITICCNLSVSAADTVVVIPLGGGSKTPGNIITVAKQNGDFTDPRVAVNSITDASETNPYLIVIGPGRYQVTSTIAMKPYVSITGSGRKVTTIWGEIGSIDSRTSAIIRGADNATLSNINIENEGTESSSTFITGIVNYGDSLYMNHVRVHVSSGSGGATYLRGIYNINSSLSTINDCEIRAIGSGAVGLYTTSGMFVQNSILEGSADGLYINSAGARIRNTYISGGVDDNQLGTTQCRETYDYDFNDVSC